MCQETMEKKELAALRNTYVLQLYESKKTQKDLRNTNFNRQPQQLQYNKIKKNHKT